MVLLALQQALSDASAFSEGSLLGEFESSASILHFLLDQIVRVENGKVNWNLASYHHAAPAELLQRIIQLNNATQSVVVDVNAPDHMYLSPLSKAVFVREMKVIDALLENGGRLSNLDHQSLWQFIASASDIVPFTKLMMYADSIIKQSVQQRNTTDATTTIAGEGDNLSPGVLERRAEFVLSIFVPSKMVCVHTFGLSPRQPPPTNSSHPQVHATRVLG